MTFDKKLVPLFSYLSLAVCVVFQVNKTLHWGHGSWEITEWLINYSGGFVRRGLPGEAAFLLWTHSGVRVNYVVVGVSLALYAILSYFLMSRARAYYPRFVLFSALLLGAPVYQNSVVRKDALCLLCLIVCLVVNAGNFSPIRKFLFINASAVVAILSHEEFVFFALPALVLMGIASDDSAAIGIKRLATSTLKLSPSLFALALVIVFHGNTTVATAVNSSWQRLWSAIEPGVCCLDKPAAAIDALGWTAAQSRSLAATELHSFSYGIWAPLGWIVTIVLCFYFMIHFLGSKDEGEVAATGNLAEKTRMGGILLFQFAFISPLFLLGCDFGRWIYLWTTSSLVLFLFGFAPELFIFQRCCNISARLNSSRLMRAHPRPWCLLFFGYPQAEWKVDNMINSTPAGALVLHIANRILYHHR